MGLTRPVEKHRIPWLPRRSMLERMARVGHDLHRRLNLIGSCSLQAPVLRSGIESPGVSGQGPRPRPLQRDELWQPSPCDWAGRVPAPAAKWSLGPQTRSALNGCLNSSRGPDKIDLRWDILPSNQTLCGAKGASLLIMASLITKSCPIKGS